MAGASKISYVIVAYNMFFCNKMLYKRGKDYIIKMEYYVNSFIRPDGGG